MAGAAAGSQRSFRNSPTGVPAGTEGCDMSAGVAWLATWLPAAAVLTKGDGRHRVLGPGRRAGGSGHGRSARVDPVEHGRRGGAGLASPDSGTRSGVLDPV